MIRSIFAFLALLLAPACAAADKALPYEPSEVCVEGSLRGVVRYGPPNYGEEPANDALVRFMVLDLDKPVTVSDYTSLGGSNQDIQKSIGSFQIRDSQNILTNAIENQRVGLLGGVDELTQCFV